MTLDEIEDWLSHHIQLRRNVISDRQEYRWLENDALEGRGPWLNYDDHTLNTLYRRMGKVKTVKRDEIDWVVCSDYAKDFDPFYGGGRHRGRWLRGVAGLPGVSAKVARGDGGVVGQPRGREPDGAGVHRAPGHLQDHVDEPPAAPWSA